MDALKLLLSKRKQELPPPSDPTKSWVKQSDLDKQHLDKYLSEQAILDSKKLASFHKKLLEEEDFFSSQPYKKHKKDHLDQQNIVKPEAKAQEDLNNLISPLPKHEVKRRLRNIGQPITLFGEDEWMRYNRLRKCESESLDNVEKGLGGEGNTFQKDLKLDEDEFKQLKEVNEDEEDKHLLEKLKVYTLYCFSCIYIYT